MKDTVYNLEELRQICGNDTSSMLEFVDLFVQTIQLALDEIRAFEKQNDLVSVSDVLHRIRPSVQIFGRKALFSEMKELEDLFRGPQKAQEGIERLPVLLGGLQELIVALTRDRENFV